MGKLKDAIESNWFTNFIMVVIVLNAITLALETSKSLQAEIGTLLTIIDQAALGIFVVELVAKLIVYRHRFFLSGWNVFDFVIVGISLLPAAGPLTVLRALRILRLFRLISLVPQMRKVVEALLHALPGMGSIVLLMGVVFFVGAVMATKLFGEDHAATFGTLGDSLFTLFAIMTLEGWADVAREVQATHPQAYLFFVPFIVISVFAVLNLFIALLTNSMQEIHEAEAASQTALDVKSHEAFRLEVKALQAELAALRKLLEASNPKTLH